MWEINEFTIQDELENVQKKIYKNCFENCYMICDKENLDFYWNNESNDEWRNQF